MLDSFHRPMILIFEMPVVFDLLYFQENGQEGGSLLRSSGGWRTQPFLASPPCSRLLLAVLCVPRVRCDPHASHAPEPAARSCCHPSSPGLMANLPCVQLSGKGQLGPVSFQITAHLPSAQPCPSPARSGGAELPSLCRKELQPKPTDTFDCHSPPSGWRLLCAQIRHSRTLLFFFLLGSSPALLHKRLVYT